MFKHLPNRFAAAWRALTAIGSGAGNVPVMGPLAAGPALLGAVGSLFLRSSYPKDNVNSD